MTQEPDLAHASARRAFASWASPLTLRGGSAGRAIAVAGIALAVLILAVAIVSSRTTAMGLFAIGAGAAVVAHRTLAIYAAAFIAFTAPQVVAAAPELAWAPMLAVVLLLSIALVHRLTSYERRLVAPPALLPLAALLLIHVVSALGSANPTRSATGVAAFALQGAASFLLVSLVAQSRIVLRHILWTLVFAAAVMSLVMIEQRVLGSGHGLLPGAVLSAEGDASDRARAASLAISSQLLTLAIPLAITLAGIERPRRRWIVAAIAAGVIGLGVALSLSPGVVIGLAVGLVAIAVLRRIKPRAAFVVGIAAGVVLVGSLRLVAGPAVDPAAETPELLRAQATADAAVNRAFVDHPFLGVGPGLLDEHVDAYAGEIGAPSVASVSRGGMYARLAAETGVLGLVTLGGFVVVTLRSLLLARRRDPVSERIATGLIVASVVFLATGLVMPNESPSGWLVFGMVGAAAVAAYPAKLLRDAPARVAINRRVAPVTAGPLAVPASSALPAARGSQAVGLDRGAVRPVGVPVPRLRVVSRAIARQLALSADFLIVLGVAIGLLALVAAEQAGWPLAAVQVPLGLAYVLVVPGYCLTVAVFPRANDLDGVERLGLAVGLSLASTAILALVLDRLPWGLRTWPILAGEYAVTLVFAAAASLRRNRIENAGPTTAAVLRPRQWWRSEPPSQRQAYRRIVLLSVFVAGLCAAVFLSPPLDNSLSTFYALGPAGQVADYPYRVAVGDTVAVTIGIDNQTHAAVRYRYEIWERAVGDSEGGVLLVTSKPFELAAGETRQESVSWRMTHVGPRQRVDALLFEDDETSPSRQLRFWVDVSDLSAPP